MCVVVVGAGECECSVRVWCVGRTSVKASVCGVCQSGCGCIWERVFALCAAGPSVWG